MITFISSKYHSFEILQLLSKTYSCLLHILVTMTHPLLSHSPTNATTFSVIYPSSKYDTSLTSSQVNIIQPSNTFNILYPHHYLEAFVQQFYLLLYKCLFDIFTCFDCTSSTSYFSASSDFSSIADAIYILSSTDSMSILTSIGSIDDLSQCKIYSLDTCLLACQTQLTHLHFFQTADTIFLIQHSIQDTIISHFAIPTSGIRKIAHIRGIFSSYLRFLCPQCIGSF